MIVKIGLYNTSFVSGQRLHKESAREFGKSLCRLVVGPTQNLATRDQFITHFATGDFRINLCSAEK